MPKRSSFSSLISLLSVLLFVVPAGASDDPRAVLRQLSQQFSDASASGDAAVLARLLDDRVVFVNENGDMSTKKEIVESTTRVSKNSTRTLTQSDFAVQFHGNVAVTSFTDNLKQPFYGQTFVSSFKSTEVWLRESAGWKMISSQTLEAYSDPPATTLDDRALAGYTGTYTAGTVYVVTIARDGDGITTSANGAKPVKLEAELKDVFFIPGQRGRRLFTRDPAGKITGYISRREGHDIVLTRVS